MSQKPQPVALPGAFRAPYPAEEDVTASLRIAPGLYTATSLYTYYCDLATAAGRLPASSNGYGRALRRLGYQSRRDTTGTRRCWIIPAP